MFNILLLRSAVKVLLCSRFTYSTLLFTFQIESVRCQSVTCIFTIIGIDEAPDLSLKHVIKSDLPTLPT